MIHNHEVTITGIYSGLDGYDRSVPSIALTFERLEYFKGLLTEDGEKPCCNQSYLHITVENNGRKLILRCVTTNISRNPDSMKEALLSDVAARMLGVQITPTIVRFEKMEMLCDGGAETAQLILAVRRSDASTANLESALGDRVVAEIEGIVPKDL